MTTKHRSTYTDAIRRAKEFAAQTGEAFSVWRQGEEFFVCCEATGPDAYIERNNSGPVRLVATYDPDGTEYA